MSAPARRFAVIGLPVSHSRSPRMHGAAYGALGLPHVYDRLETTAEELPARVDALRRGELAGINVTVPHKAAVLALVDRLDASAEAMGAGNTLVRANDGAIVAYNTDAPALAAEITALLPVGTRDLRGRSAIVLGTGGAARAALFALGTLGVARVTVRGRREVPELAQVLARGALSSGLPPPSLSFSSLAPPAEESADLGAIIQATTAGMTGAAPGEVVADAIAWTTVPRDAVAIDVVYAPAVTPFLERAASSALPHAGGLGMLVGQGALAFELWLGLVPPRDVMRAAVL